MRILMVHNRYQQPGGEDSVFEAEANLLAANGHDVVREEDSNDRLREMAPLTMAAATIWNDTSRRRIGALVKRHQSQVVHFHNTFPLISPSALYGARRAGAAVVQTLHNFRLTCLNGLLFRDGAPCEDCVRIGSVMPGVRHKCYRNSRAASSTVATMLKVHRALGTWNRAVDVYVTPTEFAASIFLRSGLPQARLVVAQNFVRETSRPNETVGSYFLFAGRLSEEKGVRVLLEAWDRLGSDIPLHIAGGGPLEELVKETTRTNPATLYLGHISSSEVLEQMRGAVALVFPSLCYEVAPVSIVEALAAGRPAIVSRHGAPQSMVEDGATGYYFKPGDSGELAEKVRRVWNERTNLSCVRQRCKELFERKYCATQHYQRLMEIYAQAIASRAS